VGPRRRRDDTLRGNFFPGFRDFGFGEEGDLVLEMLWRRGYFDVSNDETILHEINDRLMSFQHIESEKQVYIFSLIVRINRIRYSTSMIWKEHGK
jgi:hypothetical protein